MVVTVSTLIDRPYFNPRSGEDEFFF